MELIIMSALGRRQEDALAPDNRGTDAGPLEGSLPADVLRGRPVNGQIFLPGDADALRPTPRRPIGCPNQGSRAQENDESEETIRHENAVLDTGSYFLSAGRALGKTRPLPVASTTR